MILEDDKFMQGISLTKLVNRPIKLHQNTRGSETGTGVALPFPSSRQMESQIMHALQDQYLT